MPTTVLYSRKVVRVSEKQKTRLSSISAKTNAFDAKDFGDACFWIGENDLRLDLQVFEMKAKDFDSIQLQDGLLIEPPPKEKGLFRVVYAMSMPPVKLRQRKNPGR